MDKVLALHAGSRGFDSHRRHMSERFFRSSGPGYENWNTHTHMYSNSRNDAPRVDQRSGTIAAYTRRRASVLVVFEVFCVHMYSFAGLIRRTPPLTFSDTAITDRHSDTTNFQLRALWVRIFWSIGSEKSFGHVPPVEVEPSTTSCKDSTLSTRPGSPLKNDTGEVNPPFIVPSLSLRN